MSRRVFVIILDGLGLGDLPDSAQFGDEGCNTLAHVAAASGGLSLPNLEAMGLGRVQPFDGMNPDPSVSGAHGRMAEKSHGKDSTTGHWELAGLMTEKAFPLYPQGFPAEVLAEVTAATGFEMIGNLPASGTDILEELGPRHLETGKLILYTSADSVFQVAAHEDVLPVAGLHAFCARARKILSGEHAVSRVIARPFRGRPGAFERGPDRRDFSLPPHGDTMLDRLRAGGISVTGVGKVTDLFAHRGFSREIPSKGNRAGMDAFLSLAREGASGFYLVNLVDFDMLWGHRNDPIGFAGGLREFDAWLPLFQAALRPGDFMLLTADHGNDPTTRGSDHTREYVPVLAWSPDLRVGVDLGVRDQMSDLAETVMDAFDLTPFGTGLSFWPSIKEAMHD